MDEERQPEPGQARPVASVPVSRVNADQWEVGDDAIAVEEPLEIRVRSSDAGNCAGDALSVTMRTPGADLELAAGFLFAEGVVEKRADLVGWRPCARGGVLRVDLADACAPRLSRLQRSFVANSSCGVCGKRSLGGLRAPRLIDSAGFILNERVVHALPGKLRRAQSLFERTGGLHAAGLFDGEGNLLCLREDVGRHNAVDKLVGHHLLTDSLPLDGRLLLVSGRVSYEIVQKAAKAAVPVVAAVGAPSSFAVRLADECGMTLLGFVRDRRFNIYTHARRVSDSASKPATPKRGAAVS